MQATLTLPKAAILEKLEARKTELKDKYAERIAKVQKVLDDRENEEDRAAQLEAWHRAVADGLASGDITLTPKGSLRGAPVKPGSKTSIGGYYGRHHDDYRHYNTEQLEWQIKNFEDERERALKPLETQIELIGLSTDTEIVVNAADYQALLNGNRHGYY